MVRCAAVVVSVVVFLLAAPVSAQRAPDLATLDRGDGISKVGIDLGLTVLDGSLYDVALRAEIHGQYVFRNGLGFYGAFPLAASLGDEDDGLLDEDQDTIAIGDLELGALYVIEDYTWSLVFRGGVALPTASDEVDGRLTNFAATWPRLTDLALTVPEVFIRLSVSPILHSGGWFLRGDIGFDLGVDVEDMLRLNIGGGVDLGTASLALELVNIAGLEGDDDLGDRFIHTLAFTARFMLDSIEPVVTVGLPLDDGYRDTVKVFIAFGLQTRLR